MARLCDEGAKHRCFGPWYLCAVFGCAVNNPRPRADGRKTNAEMHRERESNERRQVNINYLKSSAITTPDRKNP